MNIIVVLINGSFQNTMWACDQKLMIDLEWPKAQTIYSVFKDILIRPRDLMGQGI